MSKSISNKNKNGYIAKNDNSNKIHDPFTNNVLDKLTLLQKIQVNFKKDFF